MEIEENVIEWIKGEKTAGVTLTSRKFKNRIRRYAEQYPDNVQIISENDDGSIFAHIPTGWIRISRPNSGRALTDEEKLKNAKRLENWRKKQGATRKDAKHSES